MSPEDFDKLLSRLVCAVHWHVMKQREFRYVPVDEFLKYVAGDIPAEPYEPMAFMNRREVSDAMAFARGVCCAEYDKTILRMKARIAQIAEPLRESGLTVHEAVIQCIKDDDFCWLMNQMAAYEIASCVVVSQINSMEFLHRGTPLDTRVDVLPSYIKIVEAKRVAKIIADQIPTVAL